MLNKTGERVPEIFPETFIVINSLSLHPSYLHQKEMLVLADVKVHD